MERHREPAGLPASFRPTIAGADGSRWASRTSNPLAPALRSGRWVRLPRAPAIRARGRRPRALRPPRPTVTPLPPDAGSGTTGQPQSTPNGRDVAARSRGPRGTLAPSSARRCPPDGVPGTVDTRMRVDYAGITPRARSSVVERSAHNRLVAGSIPAEPTRSYLRPAEARTPQRRRATEPRPLRRGWYVSGPPDVASPVGAYCASCGVF